MNMKLLKLSVTNCFLIGIGPKFVLIDTGYERDWGLFRRRLKEADVGLSDISHLVLTHHHDDHCGLLNGISQANKETRIAMSYRAKEFLAEGKNDRSHGGGYVNRRVRMLLSLWQKFDKQWKTHSFPPYAARESDILVQGETHLEDIGIGLSGRIIETPGHTVDSISVLFEDGSCFVGDVAANIPRFVGTKYCVILIEDIEEYYQSWRRLISEGARTIFPAHGKRFPVAKLEQNLGKIEKSGLIPLA